MEFTEKYFLEEINRFRQECGNKSFWEKTEEQHEKMISGLSFCYLNITNEDKSRPTNKQIENWAKIFDSALDNYNRRKTMIMMLPLKRFLGI